MNNVRKGARWSQSDREAVLPVLLLLCIIFSLVAPFWTTVWANPGDVTDEGSRTLPMNITFSNNGNSGVMDITLQKERTVSGYKASFSGYLDGPVKTTYQHTFASNGNHLMYTGSAEKVPPVGGPFAFQESKVAPASYDNISMSDDLYIASKIGFTNNVTPNGTYIYHHFEFNVNVPGTDDTSATLSDMTIHWEGNGEDGFDNTKDEARLYAWNWADARWDLLDSSPSTLKPDIILNSTVSPNADSYLSNNTLIDLMVVGPTFDNTVDPDPMFTNLSTDFVSLNTTWSSFTYPSDVQMDIGGDGSVEWTHAGNLTETVVSPTDDAVIILALQQLIDGMGPGPGDFTAPVWFYSSTVGVMTIHDFDVEYLALVGPSFKAFPTDLAMTEDVSSDNILDLWDYAVDDFGVVNLSFSIDSVDDLKNVSVGLDPDGHNVDVVVGTDWNGEFSFKVRAVNRFNMSVLSPDIKITVLPDNDAPVMDKVPDQKVQEHGTISFDLMAYDIDMDPLMFFDDTDLFDVDPILGHVDYSPTEDQDGTYVITVGVTDGEFNVTESFTLTVLEIDDPPVIEPLATGIIAYEDRPKDIRVNATDPEGDDIVFSISPDTYKIDPATGEVSLLPTAKDVGTHQVKVTATAGNLWDAMVFDLIVKDVNDLPVIEWISIRDMNGSDNMTEDKDIIFVAGVFDEEGHGTLSFEWFANGNLISTAQNFTSQLKADDYVVEFIVSDQDGFAKRSMSITVGSSLEVIDPPPPPPKVPRSTFVISEPEEAAITVAVSVAVVSAVVVGTEVGKFGFFFFLAPLFSRIRKEEALDSFTRGKIFGAILTEPGISYNLLREITGVGNGTLAHHLKVLARTKYIIIRRDGLFKRFYPAEVKIPKKHKVLVDIQRLIMNSILECPGVTQSEIAEMISVRRQVVNYHVKKLSNLNLVSCEKVGNTARCYPNEIEILESGLDLGDRSIQGSKGETTLSEDL